MVRSMMSSADLPVTFWGDTLYIQQLTCLIEYLPSQFHKRPMRYGMEESQVLITLRFGVVKHMSRSLKLLTLKRDQ
ncbi:hypothetical protein ACFX2J_000295 [Malus domestica]